MTVFSWCLRIIGLCVAALALASCSAVKLGYGQLPDLAYWWIDGYIDTTEAQTPRLRSEIAALHQWHRTSELPEYTRLLQKMQRLAPGPISPEQACGVFEEARERYKVLSARIEAPALWLAQTLTSEQLQHLERKYGKTNGDWQAKWLRGSPAERLQHRLKQAVERNEILYGSLEETQIQTLRADLTQSSYNAQKLWAERLRRQQDILQSLRALNAGTLPPGAARDTHHALLERLATSPDAAFRAYSATTVREDCAIFSRLHNSTTAIQRARAVETLRKYEEDFRALAASR